jgi:hypothetical protein
MDALKKKIAALGFICFFSFGLLPVGISVCGPFTSMLSHMRHAKSTGLAAPAAAAGLKRVQSGRQTVENDLLLEEENGSGKSFHGSTAVKPATMPLRGSEFSFGRRHTSGGKVSTFLLQSVLNL